LRAAGVRVLENEAILVEARGSRLWGAGVADLRTRELRLDEALSSTEEGAPIILLSHDPDVFPDVPERVALTLAGHLHGGQIDLPGLRRFASFRRASACATPAATSRKVVGTST
jgi:uncharacterized protein